MSGKTKKKWWALSLIAFFAFYKNTVLAGEEINLKVISKPDGIEISWPKEILNEMETAVIIKKENSCPVDIYDGREVYRGNGRNFVDKEVEKNKKYCYGLVVSDDLGNISDFLNVKQIEKESAASYYLKILGTNYILIVGPIIIVILWLVDKLTRQRDLERMRKIERIKILREV